MEPATEPAQPSLRERKKQQTRQAIAAAAFEMFAERGFDAVTVAAVARRADVSEATVFNYFPTKEDLVYGRLEEFEAALVRTVRERAPGQSIIAAISGFLLEQRGLLGARDPESHAQLVTVNRIIAASSSLLARERQIYDRYTRTLAALIAEQRGVGQDDAEPRDAEPWDVEPRDAEPRDAEPWDVEPWDVESWVVANAIIGVHRGLVEYVRRNALAGRTGSSLARRVRAEAERALAVLDRGLAGYPAGQ
jgi:AcrR family transcriptional regulator